MIDNLNGTITLTDENNEQVVVQTLYTFELPEYKKKYIVYTIDPKEDDEDINVLISEIDYDTLQIKKIPDSEIDDVIRVYNETKEMLLEE